VGHQKYVQKWYIPCFLMFCLPAFSSFLPIFTFINSRPPNIASTVLHKLYVTRSTISLHPKILFECTQCFHSFQYSLRPPTFPPPLSLRNIPSSLQIAALLQLIYNAAHPQKQQPPSSFPILTNHTISPPPQPTEVLLHFGPHLPPCPSLSSSLSHLGGRIILSPLSGTFPPSLFTRTPQTPTCQIIPSLRGKGEPRPRKYPGKNQGYPPLSLLSLLLLLFRTVYYWIRLPPLQLLLLASNR
jgi:hypothetical protein